MVRKHAGSVTSAFVHDQFYLTFSQLTQAPGSLGGIGVFFAGYDHHRPGTIIYDLVVSRHPKVIQAGRQENHGPDRGKCCAGGQSHVGPNAGPDYG